MKDGLYADDLISGGKMVKEALEIYRKTRTRLMQGGFSMHKWKSNDDNMAYAKSSLGNVQDAADKLLGIFWNELDDTLKFTLEEIANYAVQLEVPKRMSSVH